MSLKKPEHTTAPAESLGGAPLAAPAAAPEAGKRGRKPAAPYVPVSFNNALFLVVTQTKTGLVAKGCATPEEAEAVGSALAQKGQDVLLFGPQAMALRKAVNPVEKLTFDFSNN